MDFYLYAQVGAEICCDGLRYPKYSHVAFTELSEILNSQQNASLVLSVARFGKYSDGNYFFLKRQAIAEVLKRKGILGKRGKRTRPGSAEFVEDVTPVLIALGLKPSISERSKMVRALRLIAEELGIQGDPREHLRWFKKMGKKANIEQKNAAWLEWLEDY